MHNNNNDKEPARLWRTDVRDWTAVLVPCQSGKSVCWDVTVICSLAESYVSGAAREAGAAEEVAASHKEEKYEDLDGCYLFKPIAAETSFFCQQPVEGDWQEHLS